MYYDKEEFLALAQLFDVEISGAHHEWKWLPIASQLLLNVEHGNNRELLVQIVEQLEIRNLNAIARTDWERRTPHQHLEDKLNTIKRALGDPAIPRELGPVHTIAGPR